jgi:hypothetical protein
VQNAAVAVAVVAVRDASDRWRVAHRFDEFRGFCCFRSFHAVRTVRGINTVRDKNTVRRINAGRGLHAEFDCFT